MASTYLQRTFSSGNQKTWTWSGWYKKCINDTQICLFNRNTSNNLYVVFRSDNKIELVNYVDAVQALLITNAQYRDPSAWYHIVYSIDTTQATSSDRVKLYINGVQETSFSTATYPSQNYDLAFNTADVHNIGVYFGGGSIYNGSMSHVHFIDGTAYDATAFGEYDANGVWKIKTSPSVTYGTNGFFILKDGNSVTDQSGNSNNFTVGGGTLTNTEDSPSNVFATLNPLDNFYNSSTFSNGNNTVVTGLTPYTFNTSTLGVSTGKYYAEFKFTSGTIDNGRFGIVGRLSGATSDNLGKYSDQYGYNASGTITNNNSATSYGGSFGLNDIVGVGLDLDNNKLYFSINGTWQNSADPSAGTGGYSISSASSTTLGNYFFAVSDQASDESKTIQCNFGNGYFGTTAVASAGSNASGIGIFEYDVPTGFTALSTKGLNL